MERSVKDKQLLTSAEIQGLIQTACIGLEQRGITPNTFGQGPGCVLNGLECAIYCCPAHYRSPWAVCLTGKGPPALGTQEPSHTINKNNYTNELFSTF